MKAPPTVLQAKYSESEYAETNLNQNSELGGWAW